MKLCQNCKKRSWYFSKLWQKFRKLCQPPEMILKPKMISELMKRFHEYEKGCNKIKETMSKITKIVPKLPKQCQNNWKGNQKRKKDDRIPELVIIGNIGK